MRVVVYMVIYAEEKSEEGRGIGRQRAGGFLRVAVLFRMIDFDI